MELLPPPAPRFGQAAQRRSNSSKKRAFEFERSQENTREYERIQTPNPFFCYFGIDAPAPIGYNNSCAKRRGALPCFANTQGAPQLAPPRRFGNKMAVYAMSTTLAKPAEMVDRKWYVIDAAGKPLGRVAAKAAVLLRGKDKVMPDSFRCQLDTGSTAMRFSSAQHMKGAVFDGKFVPSRN